METKKIDFYGWAAVLTYVPGFILISCNWKNEKLVWLLIALMVTFVGFFFGLSKIANKKWWSGIFLAANVIVSVTSYFYG